MTETQVEALLDKAPGAVRADAYRLMDIMAQATVEEPTLWNGNTVGFGRYHYRYASGVEGDFFKIGFAPKSRGITIYVMSGLRGFDDILSQLGPHAASKSTIKFKRLEEISSEALTALISECVRHLDSVEHSLGAIPRMSEIPPRIP